MKNPWKIFLCMVIYFGCSEKIAEDNAEPNKTSENLKSLGYEIDHFNDTLAEVRIIFERLKDLRSYPIKVILNSTEWEITVHLHDFDEFWQSYASGKGSDIEILKSRFFKKSYSFRWLNQLGSQK